MAQWEITLRGRVQGVGFRNYARRHALKLGLTGNVRNHPDGSVRIIIETEDRLQMDIYRELLRRGSLFSRIDSLDTETIDTPNRYNGFEIL